MLCVGITRLVRHRRRGAGSPQPRPTEAAAIKQFEAAIADYLALRRRLLSEVPAPSRTPRRCNSTTPATRWPARFSDRGRAQASAICLCAPVTAVFKRRSTTRFAPQTWRPCWRALTTTSPRCARRRSTCAFPRRATGDHAAVAAGRVADACRKSSSTASSAAISCFATSMRR